MKLEPDEPTLWSALTDLLVTTGRTEAAHSVIDTALDEGLLDPDWVRNEHVLIDKAAEEISAARLRERP